MDHRVILSDSALLSYNLIQEKSFRINKNFEQVLQELDTDKRF